jgi:hypothetical protein
MPAFPPPLRDRMFHVLVLGGIGLVAPACGGAISPALPRNDAATDAFPSEGPAHIDAGSSLDAHSSFDAFPSETAERLDAFPAETDSIPDAFPTEGLVPPDAFPTEGPAQIDASPPPPMDAGAPEDAGCFPEETAFISDAACK